MSEKILSALLKRPTIELVTAALKFRGNEQKQLFELARRFKDKRVYLRASIELSNYCRQNCAYCGNRRDNILLQRFRISGNSLVGLVDEALRVPEVDFVHFSFGEDINYPFGELANQISKIYANGKAVTLVLGDLPPEILERLQVAAGGKPIRYAVKFETGDPELFSKIKGGYSLDRRLAVLARAGEQGFQLASGLIAGLPGQTLESIARDLIFLKDYPLLVNLSVSTFLPSPNSPFEKESPGDNEVTLNALAIIRILCRGREITIPASSSLGVNGQKTALAYFANLVSIHLLPEDYADQYLIYGGKSRHFGRLEKIREMIGELGLEFNRG